jgi:hypothetical protein
MVLQTAAYALGKRVGPFLLGGLALWQVALGGLVLWQVVRHVGPPNGTAIVHVSVPDVDLMVDHISHRVGDLSQSPIVCALKAGPHTVRMLLDGQVLYREEFNLGGGEEIILVAWDQRAAVTGTPHDAAPCRNSAGIPDPGPKRNGWNPRLFGTGFARLLCRAK